jgi:hypothetical protein
MTHSIFSKPRPIGRKPGIKRELSRAQRRAKIRDRIVAIMRERVDRIAAERERRVTLH